MPAQFPEIWLRRVIRNISEAGNAPFFDDIPELDVDIVTLGEGSASEKNIIHVTSTQFKPEVLINSTTYPIALQDYDDEGSTIQLDKYQTKVTTVSDDQAIGAAYNKIDVVTQTHTEAIREKKFAKAVHAHAPASNTALTPVLMTTGADDGTGRKRLVYADLVRLKNAFDKMGAPLIGRRLPLCTDHWNDLLLDRERFGDMLVNYKEGNPAPKIASFETFQYIDNPLFNAGVKRPFGAVPGAGDFQASIAFVKSNVAKKTGLTKQYFAKASDDPENQMNKLNYRHYYINVPMQARWIGAMTSGV